MGLARPRFSSQSVTHWEHKNMLHFVRTWFQTFNNFHFGFLTSLLKWHIKGKFEIGHCSQRVVSCAIPRMLLGSTVYYAVTMLSFWFWHWHFGSKSLLCITCSIYLSQLQYQRQSKPAFMEAAAPWYFFAAPFASDDDRDRDRRLCDSVAVLKASSLHIVFKARIGIAWFVFDMPQIPWVS